MLNFETIQNVIPIKIGRVRKESFGGIYYERNRLVLEVLNDVAYDILGLCDGLRSISDIFDILINSYSVDEKILKNDIVVYLLYILKSKYVKVKEMPESLQTALDNFEINKNGDCKISDTDKPKITLGFPPYALDSPLKVLIELTNNCNLKCKHCFSNAAYCQENELGYLEGELDKKSWYKIIDNIVDSEVFEILLSGGECTLRKDLLDIAAYIQSKGYGYCLLSNATNIDEKMAIGLKNTGCVKVESNLDGYDEKTYEDFRGVKGSFEKTINGIKECLKQGLLVRCNVMETKQTVFNLEKIVDLAYSIGVREVCVVPLEQGGRAIGNRDLEFCESESEILSNYYKKVRLWFDKKYKNTDMVLLTPDCLKKDDKNQNSKAFKLMDYMPSCGAGKLHCTIDPYGNVKLCPSDTNLLKSEGNNLLKQSLKDIWQNSKVLNEIRSRKFSNCNGCENSSCENRCPVKRFRKFNSLKCYDCTRKPRVEVYNI